MRSSDQQITDALIDAVVEERDRAAEELFDVRHLGLEDGRGVIADVGQQTEPAQDPAPELVGGAAAVADAAAGLAGGHATD